MRNLKSSKIIFRISTIFLVALLIVQISAQVKVAEKEDYSLEKASEEFEIRKIKIQAELSELQNHDWAGEYSVNSQILLLAPKSGFVYFMSGGDYDKNWKNSIVNYGTVEFSNEKIKLIPELSYKEEILPGFSSGLFPVLWSARHYLIGGDEFIKFANAVNIGYEPSFAIGGLSNHFFLRKGDIEKKVTGKPNLPEQYRNYLLEKPLRGKISAIKDTKIEQDGSQRQRKSNVIINVGRSSGVKEGMDFLVYDPRRISDEIKIIKVENDWSEGVIIQTYLESKIPSIGWKISTSLKDIK